MNKVTLVYTSQPEVGGTVYHHLSWWALDRYGRTIAGPRSNKREIAKDLASGNRGIMRRGYDTRLLYTAY